MNKLYPALIGIFCALTVASASANQITVINTTNKPVTYQRAVKERLGAIKYSDRVTLAPHTQDTFSMNLGLRNKAAGVIVNKVGQKELPSSINAFDKNAQCSVASTRHANTRILTIGLKRVNGKRELQCITNPV